MLIPIQLLTLESGLSMSLHNKIKSGGLNYLNYLHFYISDPVS